MPSRPRSDRRLRSVLVALLLLVTAAAWIGVVIQSRAMSMPDSPSSAGMPANADPFVMAARLAAFTTSWVVMMAAMMLPSAAPMILMFHAAARARTAHGDSLVPTWIFILGYLVVWAAFGAAVYVASQLVDLAIAADPRRARLAPYGVALVLAAAGAYQLTALKRVCLRHCQHPLAFLMQHWNSGRLGALRMGLEHGWYCTGCCWGLMAVLVAAGAMGLAWVLLIALVVAAEKLLPHGQWAARVTGGALLAMGALVAAQPQLVTALRGSGM